MAHSRGRPAAKAGAAAAAALTAVGFAGVLGFTGKPTETLQAARRTVVAASVNDAATADPAPTTGGQAQNGGGDDPMPLVGVGAVAVLIGAGALFATRRRTGGRD